jgi:hypothetical protein
MNLSGNATYELNALGNGAPRGRLALAAQTVLELSGKFDVDAKNKPPEWFNYLS